MKCFIKSVTSIYVLLMLFSCTGNQNLSSVDEHEPKVNRNAIENIVDSLLRVHPMAFDNPIQKSDFIMELKEAVHSLDSTDFSKTIESMPFKLYQIQPVANQSNDKYLTAFTFEKEYGRQDSSDKNNTVIKEKCEIKIYCFGALDKTTASKLEKYGSYKLEGNPVLVGEPSLG